MNINPTSPWPTVCHNTPYTLEKNSSPLTQDFSQLKERNLPEGFERLAGEILKAIAEQEKSATLTWSKVLQAEQGWRDTLLQEQVATEKSKATWQSWNGLFKKCAELIVPLCLVAEGATVIFTSGATLPIVAAVSLGGILVLDEILDNTGKRAVASLLSKTNSEDTETWLRRITIVTSVILCAATLAMGFSPSIPNALKVATTASGVVLTCTQAGTELGLNNKRAQLATLDFSWEESTRRFSDLLNNTKKQIEAANFVFDKNMELQKSVLATSRQILT